MITFKNISKSYDVGQQKVHALKDVNFTIEKGELTVVLGPSGSGKSTMLNILGGMDRPTSGSVEFDLDDLTDLNDKELTNYRRDVVGFVFQFYNLIPNLTALENVGIAASLTGNSHEADVALENVNLALRRNNFPSQLSGGEMQRVAIARALAKKPQLLLCDEPTGALDSKTGISIVTLLKEVAKTTETAVVLVTHNADFAQIADKVIRLQDGEVKHIEVNELPVSASEVTW